LAAFFATSINQPIPPPPFTSPDKPHLLLGGRSGRFISKIMRSKQSLSFAVGILYLKKGLPRPDEEFCIQSEFKTYLTLTNIHPCAPISFEVPFWETDESGKVQEDYSFGLDEMKVEVRRTVEELFLGTSFSPDDIQPFAPSIKANYTSSRSKFGTLGTMEREGLVRELQSVLDAQELEHYGNALRPVSWSSFENECITPSGGYYELNPELKEALDEKFDTVYDSAFALALTESKTTSLVTLPEALKARTISKGPPLTYYVLKPIQKFIHNHLRKIPAFSLIGETVGVDHLKKFLPLEGSFLSLDYSDATNMLNPELSRECANAICDICIIDDSYRGLMLSALTGHKIRPSKEFFECGLLEDTPLNRRPKAQLWGQLMGSIMSFVILCIINAALCRKAYEIGNPEMMLDNVPLQIKDVPMLINGDDGLLRCNDATRLAWEKLGTLCGLSPSPGKVYFHDTYLNINSQSFVFNPSSNTFSQVTYVNMGLMRGMKRSGTDSRQNVVAVDDTKTIGAQHRELINYSPYFLKKRVHELFLRTRWEMLSKKRFLGMCLSILVD